MTRRASVGHRSKLPRLETRRLAARAKDALLETITSGGFPDGHLPSEEALAEQLGISRTTIREALRSLEEEGLVTRQRGIGTWVNDHVVRATSLNRVVGFYDLIQEAGYTPAIDWTRVSRGPAGAEVARRLGEPEDAPVLVVERLFLADGAPVVHIVENVPTAELTSDVADADIPESIFAFAERRCRMPIDHTVVEIVPVVAGAEVAATLQLAKGTPLLRLIETHYAAEGRPFVVSTIHAVDRYLRFTVVRKTF